MVFSFKIQFAYHWFYYDELDYFWLPCAPSSSAPESFPLMSGPAFQIVLANNKNLVRATNTTHTATILGSTIVHNQNTNLITEKRAQENEQYQFY